MYPDERTAQRPTGFNQLGGAPIGNGLSGYAGLDVACTGPQPSGIATRIGDLQKTVSEIQGVVYDVRAALGISMPEQEGEKPQVQSTLAEVITDLRCRLSRAVIDLREVVQHINS